MATPDFEPGKHAAPHVEEAFVVGGRSNIYAQVADIAFHTAVEQGLDEAAPFPRVDLLDPYSGGVVRITRFGTSDRQPTYIIRAEDPRDTTRTELAIAPHPGYDGTMATSGKMSDSTWEDSVLLTDEILESAADTVIKQLLPEAVPISAEEAEIALSHRPASVIKGSEARGVLKPLLSSVGYLLNHRGVQSPDDPTVETGWAIPDIQDPDTDLPVEAVSAHWTKDTEGYIGVNILFGACPFIPAEDTRLLQVVVWQPLSGDKETRVSYFLLDPKREQEPARLILTFDQRTQVHTAIASQVQIDNLQGYHGE